ncbi:MAG: peptide deformylase [Gloeobacterales cyanobacterium]
MPLAPIVSKEKLAVPPYEVFTLGDRILRQNSKNVTSINDEIRSIARKMLQTMYSYDGIGLAAPQAGINKRIIVIDTDPEEAANPSFVMINPQIHELSKDLEVGQEGCLSVPKVFGDVQRSAQLIVSFKDIYGKPQRLKASGLFARVIQHEIDHLDGVLFVDRVDNQLTLTEELKKQKFNPKDVQFQR